MYSTLDLLFALITADPNLKKIDLRKQRISLNLLNKILQAAEHHFDATEIDISHNQFGISYTATIPNTLGSPASRIK